MRRRFRRRAARMWARIAGPLSALGLLVAASVALINVPAVEVPRSGSVASSDIDVSLGGTEGAAPEARERPNRGRDRPARRSALESRLRRVRVVLPRASEERTTAVAEGRPATANSRPRPPRARRPSDRAERLPAPPQTPLFHCVHERDEHYMTIDRATVGQLDAAGTGWTCSVVGQVYEGPADGRVPIELDEQRAYVLKSKVTRTDPEAELAPLYRHWAGYDWWYEMRQADGGLVGYVAV